MIAFSKLKALIRRAAARTYDELWAAGYEANCVRHVQGRRKSSWPLAPTRNGWGKYLPVGFHQVYAMREGILTAHDRSGLWCVWDRAGVRVRDPNGKSRRRVSATRCSRLTMVSGGASSEWLSALLGLPMLHFWAWLHFGHSNDT